MQLLAIGILAGQMARPIVPAVELADSEEAGGTSDAVIAALQQAGLEDVDGIWDEELEELWDRVVGAATALCERSSSAASVLASQPWLKPQMVRSSPSETENVGLQLLVKSLQGIHV
jgi:hypothetical protein